MKKHLRNKTCGLLAGMIISASAAQAQGFQTTSTNWNVVVGGLYNTSGNWGFNLLSASATSNNTNNNQTWSTMDIDGDGKADLIVTAQNDASGYDKNFSTTNNPYWKVYLNNGSGFSATATNWPVPVGGLYNTSGNWGFNAVYGNASTNSIVNNQSWATMDLNGDNKPDLIVTAQNDASGYDKVFSPANNPYWKVYLNTGTGFSTTATNWPVPAGGLYTNAGNWGFNNISGSASVNSIIQNQTWSTMDMNGDNKPDLIVAAENDASGYEKVFSPANNPYWIVYLNTGTGFSATPTTWRVPTGGYYSGAGNWGFNATFGNASSSSTLNNQSWSTMDIDGDKKPDLIITAQNDASGYEKVFSPTNNPYWKVYLNNGTSFSTSATNWMIPVGGYYSSAGNWGYNNTSSDASSSSTLNNQTWSTMDIDGDGMADLVVSAQNDASGYEKVFSPTINPYWKAYLNTGTRFSATVTNWAVPVGGLYNSTGNWGYNATFGLASSNSTNNNQSWSTTDLDGDKKPDLIVTAQNDASGYEKVFSPTNNPYWKVYKSASTVGFESSERKTAQDVKVYPNPSNGRFTILFSHEATKAGVEVYNIMGEMILQSEGAHFDLSNFPKGAYIALISDGTRTYTKKLILQ
jgi:hypothetical protein